jgi:hypothetical protein
VKGRGTASTGKREATVAIILFPEHKGDFQCAEIIRTICWRYAEA